MRRAGRKVLSPFSACVIDYRVTPHPLCPVLPASRGRLSPDSYPVGGTETSRSPRVIALPGRIKRRRRISSTHTAIKYSNTSLNHQIPY